LWERLTQLRLLGRKNQRIAMANGLNKRKGPVQFIDRTNFKNVGLVYFAKTIDQFASALTGLNIACC